MKTVEEGETLSYRELAKELLEENDSVSLLSAALKLLTKEPNVTPVSITEENPGRTKKARNLNSRQAKSSRRREGEISFKKNGTTGITKSLKKLKSR